MDKEKESIWPIDNALTALMYDNNGVVKLQKWQAEYIIEWLKELVKTREELHYKETHTHRFNNVAELINLLKNENPKAEVWYEFMWPIYYLKTGKCSDADVVSLGQQI